MDIKFEEEHIWKEANAKFYMRHEFYRQYLGRYTAEIIEMCDLPRMGWTWNHAVFFQNLSHN